MSSSFWSKDWVFGLLIAVGFAVADNSSLIQGVERGAYDWGVRATKLPVDDRISIIAIDDESIANLGRWPWPRELHARMLDYLARGNPKVIANTVFFLEPQQDPGMVHLLKINGYLDQITQSVVAGQLQSAPRKELAELKRMVVTAVSSLNQDVKLAQAIARAGNVLLAMPVSLGQPQGNPDTKLPDYVLRNLLGANQLQGDLAQPPLPAHRAIPPIPELGRVASGIGHINYQLDVDGGARALPLFLNYYDELYPSLALETVVKSLNLSMGDVGITLGQGVRVGNLNIQTDTALRMYSYFYSSPSGESAFGADSFYDVLQGKIPPDKYRNKIVLIGTTATGVGSLFPTPISPAMAPVEILAHNIASLLNEHFFIIPVWAPMVKLGCYLFVGLYLVFLLPMLRAGAAAIFTLFLASGMGGAHLYLMTQNTMWLQLMGPLTMLGAGYLLLMTKRFLVVERGKLRSDAESADSNRMLGLAFQGQGQLDMAFEKFRKCPLDDSMLEVLYNLGLDFERKRQFGKAVSVYQYMADFKSDFRDIQQRLKRSSTMESTVVLGGGNSSAMMSTSLLSGDGTVQKAMLGRYEVEKELGKGAMGIVYLGKDPKINRVVAIKTMSLSSEFEGDELEEVKKRFFREAESAGRLNHPNIVTIYDTGEEHDLAYIAMEFLKGKDLSDHIKKDSLLPLTLVIQIIAKTAAALDYAHQNGVVHRDIKPANVMYDPQTRDIKITDFGIARLTEGGRTKTKTGMVMGTPYYMSPEQIGGKRVDGRSDLFSLGVMFYQMLTGQLPFYAKDMANLLFQITQEEPLDLDQVRPELPPCLTPIARKALAKDPEQRYQRGNQMARELVQCVKSLVKR